MKIVVDTQTLLDWQFFLDPRCAHWPLPGLAQSSADAPPSATAPDWIWVATPAMRNELAHVLQRPWPARWTTPGQQVLAFFDHHAVMCPMPAATVSRPGLRCSDAEDQKFIDLALAQAPCLLLSRDRAVLKLARRALAHQVQILPPVAWMPVPTPPAA